MPKRFLIIQTAFIGDVVLATSLIENLHLKFPDARIDFLLRKGNEALLQNHPFLNKVIVWNKQEKKLLNLLKLLADIRKERYDEVINVQRYAATGILTAFSKAKQKTGFDKNPFSRFFDNVVHHVFSTGESGLHEIDRNHLLIAHLTGAPVARPKLYPSPTDEAAIQSYTGQPFITISPASVWFTKQFPIEKWKELIDAIPSHLKIFFLGGKGDRRLTGLLRDQIVDREVVNLSGELDFLKSAALMKHAVMNYVNDSAPMHFCSAVNAPVTVVYCSTIPAFGYGPLSDVKFIVERREPLYCRPCGLHGYKACPQGHFKCAWDIDVSAFADLGGSA